MRILVVIPSYKPAYHYGGPVRSVSSLCEAMVRENHTVRVLTTNANGREKLNVETNTPQKIDGVDVTYFNRWTGDHSNFTPQLLIELWKSARSFDVIHLHAWWNLVTIPAVILCKWKGIRPVLSPRGSITHYTFSHRKAFVKRWFHQWIGEKLMKQCILHVTSRQEEEDILQYVRRPFVYTIPNLLDLPEQIVVPTGKQDVLQLVYLGRIDPKKNIEFLLEVVLKEFDIPFTLQLIGEGDPVYMEQIKRMTAKNTSITWTGGLYEENKWVQLAKSDILLLPSINENYGNVVLEALSQGTAVIVSDTVGLKDYILENELGWVAGKQTDDWRKAIRKAWSDKSRLEQIRREAPLCIRRDFQQATLVSQYVDMYLETRNKKSNLV